MWLYGKGNSSDVVATWVIDPVRAFNLVKIYSAA